MSDRVQVLARDIRSLDLRLSCEKCRAITTSVLQSGQPTSMNELKAVMDDIENMNGHMPEKDWTFEEKNEQQEDRIPAFSRPNLHGEGSNNNVGSPKVKRSKVIVESSKVWRMKVFRLIAHLLKLDPNTQKAMYQANINVDSTQLLDVTKNLKHLTVVFRFTPEQISACPLILAHPYQNLQSVTHNVATLLEQHLEWSTMGHACCPSVCDAQQSRVGLWAPSSSPLCLRRDRDSAAAAVASFSSLSLSREPYFNNEYMHSVSALHESNDGMHLPSISSLLINPVSRLNVFQYFLERNNGFSLTSTETLNLGN